MTPKKLAHKFIETYDIQAYAPIYVDALVRMIREAIEECAELVENLPAGFGDLNRNDVAARIRALALDSDDHTNAGTGSTGE